MTNIKQINSKTGTAEKVDLMRSANSSLEKKIKPFFKNMQKSLEKFYDLESNDYYEVSLDKKSKNFRQVLSYYPPIIQVLMLVESQTNFYWQVFNYISSMTNLTEVEKLRFISVDAEFVLSDSIKILEIMIELTFEMKIELSTAKIESNEEKIELISEIKRQKGWKETQEHLKQTFQKAFLELQRGLYIPTSKDAIFKNKNNLITFLRQHRGDTTKKVYENIPMPRSTFFDKCNQLKVKPRDYLK